MLTELPPLPSELTDDDIEKVATFLIALHGRHAWWRALRRFVALKQQGEDDAAAAWVHVAVAVKRLG